MKKLGMRRLLLLLSLALLPLLDCGEKRDPVRQTLDRIVQAAHERDAAAAARELASDYRDASGNGRSEVEQTLRGYFAAYETVDVTFRDVTIERAEDAARARFRADLSGRPRKSTGIAGLLPSSESYRFDLRLVREGTRWRVAWASWETAAP